MLYKYKKKTEEYVHFISKKGSHESDKVNKLNPLFEESYLRIHSFYCDNFSNIMKKNLST